MSETPTLAPPPLAFPPLCPTVTVPPTKIADDTWVIHQVQPALGAAARHLPELDGDPRRRAGDRRHRARRPTASSGWRTSSRIVEPEDVRWIFLSHDDVDHTGNLDEALAACPNAKVVCNWAMVERHTNCFEFPLDRCRWVDGRRVVRRGRPHAARHPPAGVRLADHARALRPEDEGVLGGRHVRHAAARRVDGHRRPRSRLLGLRPDAVRARAR